MKKTAVLSILALFALVAPAFGTANAAPENGILFATEAEARAWADNFLATHATPDVPALTDAEAAALVADLYAGKTVAAVNVLALQVFLQGASAETRNVVGSMAFEQFLDGIVQTEATNQGLWDTVGAQTTKAQQTVAAQNAPKVSAFMANHGGKNLASYTTTRHTQSGYCDSWNCFIANTYDTDMLSINRIQHAGVTDLLLNQIATSITYYYGYSCQLWFSFFGYSWWCSSFSGSYTNSKVLGTDLSYIIALAAGSGSFATRATAMDAAQSAYDAAGRLYTQKARETSTMSHTPAIPSNAAGASNVVCKPAQVPGPATPCVDTRSGAGDLATTSPSANVIGLQKSKTVPASKPAYPPVPATPPLPSQVPATAPDTKKAYEEIRIRDGDDQSQTQKGDASGAYVKFDAAILQTYQPNFIQVRVNGPAGGSANSPAPLPADPSTNAQFVYAAGGYFNGAGTRLNAYAGLDDPIA